MPTRFARVAALLVLSLSATAAPAADHVVFVDDGTFDPKDVTISVGDTVTFKAFGNMGSHNVHAADDSFRCAVGCRGDGSGATGDPAKTWEDTLRFDTPTVIAYQCDPHGQYGMVGTISVNAVAAGLTLRPGLSGNWSDPTPGQSGHGFQLEFLPNNGILAIWFVFNPAGTAQNWIFAQGAYDPALTTVVVPAYLEQGGAFPPNFKSSNLTVQEWGSLEFSFTDCSTGSVTWHSNAASATAGYADRTFPIHRVTSIATTTCP